MDPDDPGYRGQAEYTPWLLAIYDPFVLGFMARAVWRCPTPPVVDRYRHHLGHRHLDVGPGTGYFIEKPGYPPRRRSPCWTQIPTCSRTPPVGWRR